MLLHVQDCCAAGFSKLMIRTTDTDVVVLAVANIQNVSASELWVAFGVGKNFKYIPAHDVAHRMGPRSAAALPMFHAFSGCDTVSFFAGKGRCWQTWCSYPEATDTFLSLARGPCNIEQKCLEKLERFVGLLYAKMSQSNSVNEVRQTLFSSHHRILENIPPTQAALHQHIRRAVYQGGYIWGHCLEPNPKLPDPVEWGWQKGREKNISTSKAIGENKTLVPVWTTLDEASQACRELFHCSCQQGCKVKCKCKKANLKCCRLCSGCPGNC